MVGDISIKPEFVTQVAAFGEGEVASFNGRFVRREDVGGGCAGFGGVEVDPVVPGSGCRFYGCGVGVGGCEVCGQGGVGGDVGFGGDGAVGEAVGG